MFDVHIALLDIYLMIFINLLQSWTLSCEVNELENVSTQVEKIFYRRSLAFHFTITAFDTFPHFLYAIFAP